LTKHPHPAPLTLHHQRSDAWAERLGRVAERGDLERREVAEGFLVHFCGVVLPSMREEESALLPLLGADESGEVQRTLKEHEALCAGARRVADALPIMTPDARLLRELGRLVRQYVRREEREA
jgi:hemerythrin HHE cation binding domain-containing protein